MITLPDDKPIDIMLADANPLVLSAMSELFDRDPRFSLVATSSTAEGKRLTPRTMSMSSVRPLILPIRTRVRPQAQVSGLREVMSPVR